MNRYKSGAGKGWRFESTRHSMASRGIKTKINYSTRRERKGALIGGAIGLLGGPVGVVAGAGAGYLIAKDSPKKKKINYSELATRYDSRKSFYAKADVRQEGNKTILKSYDTDVAYIEDGKAHVLGEYSQTTNRHVREFLKQNGFFADSMKQIMKDYGAKTDFAKTQFGILTPEGKEYIRGYNDAKAGKPIDNAKSDWKKNDTRGSFADYQWYTPDSSLSISHVQDRDGKNAFVYSVNLKTGLTSLGGVHRKVVWKGRDEKLAMKKAKEYMEEHR